MLSINNVPTQDQYAAALTLGPVPTTEKVVYLIANAAVIVQLANTSRDRTEQPWGPEILVTPTNGEFQRIQGMRFRSAVAGKPAQIVAQLVEPGDPVPVGGTPFTANLSATGAIVPVGPAVIVARGTRAANVLTAGTTFAGGADLLAGDLAFTADGVSSYLLEVSARGWGLNAAGFAQLAVKLDGVQTGVFALKAFETSLLAQTLYARALLATPAAGAHTINARMYVGGGTPTATVAGGDGIGANDVPILVTLAQI